MFFLLNKTENEVVDSFTFQHLKSHRIEIGETFWGTDLKGFAYKCKLLTWDKKKEIASYEVMQKIPKISPLKHVLVQAIPDKNYLDKLVEVATLASFSKIILFESKFSPKFSPNLERIEKISLQAALLAEFVRLPVLEFQPFEYLTQNEIFIKNSLILSQHGKLLSDSKFEKNGDQKHVWVGPEGGWSTEEDSKFNELEIPKISLAEGVIYPAWLAGSVWRFGVS
jgi:RsmE family RNA methyltransferase